MYKNRLDSLKNKSDQYYSKNDAFQNVMDKIINVRPQLVGTGVICQSEPFISNLLAVAIENYTYNVLYNQNFVNTIGTEPFNKTNTQIQIFTDQPIQIQSLDKIKISYTGSSANIPTYTTMPTFTALTTQSGSSVFPMTSQVFIGTLVLNNSIPTGKYEIKITDSFNRVIVEPVVFGFRWSGLCYINSPNGIIGTAYTTNAATANANYPFPVSCPNLTTASLTNTLIDSSNYVDLFYVGSFSTNKPKNGFYTGGNSIPVAHTLLYIEAGKAPQYAFVTGYLSYASTAYSLFDGTATLSASNYEPSTYPFYDVERGPWAVKSMEIPVSLNRLLSCSTTRVEWETNFPLTAQLVNMNTGDIFDSNLTDLSNLGGLVNLRPGSGKKWFQMTIKDPDYTFETGWGKQPSFYFNNSLLTLGKYYMQIKTGYGTIERSCLSRNSNYGTPDGAIYAVRCVSSARAAGVHDTANSAWNLGSLSSIGPDGSTSTDVRKYALISGPININAPTTATTVDSNIENINIPYNTIVSFYINNLQSDYMSLLRPSSSTAGFVGFLLTKGNLTTNGATAYSPNTKCDISSDQTTGTFLNKIQVPFLAWLMTNLTNPIEMWVGSGSGTSVRIDSSGNFSTGAVVSGNFSFFSGSLINRYVYIGFFDDHIMLSASNPNEPYNKIHGTNTRYIPFNTTFNGTTLNSTGYDRLYFIYSSNANVSGTTGLSLMPKAILINKPNVYA